jgi:hypothetical protein
MGWQAVAMTQTTCPSGFGQPLTWYTSAKADPFSCECGCGGTQTCSGTVTLNEFSPDGGANCSGTPSTRQLNVTPNCVVGGYGSIYTPNSYSISDVVYGPGPACTSNPTITAQPPVVAPSTLLCSPNAGCGPDGVCLSLLESRNLCLSKPGVQTCPDGYPNATVMSSTYDDTRSCGSCSCGSTLTCTLTGVNLNNDSNACTTTGPYWMNVDDTCTAAPTPYPLNGVKALGTVTGDGTCAATSSSDPMGTVSLNAGSTITVCCH